MSPKLTASEKLKQLIIARAFESARVDYPVPMTSEQIAAIWNEEVVWDGWGDGDFDHGYIDDAEGDMRGKGELIEIERGAYAENKSRYYECDTVALRALDGSYVAYPYYHSEAKHSEPSAMEWIEVAFDVDFEEEMIPMKVWKRV